jgi:hypothetical protein
LSVMSKRAAHNFPIGGNLCSGYVTQISVLRLHESTGDTPNQWWSYLGFD